MAFKIFVYSCNLLIPIVMVIFGSVFVKHPPGSINMAYGYRTKRSMKNQETWDFAHEYCGRIWKNAGIISLIITLLISFAVFFMDDDGAGYISLILVHLQLVILIGSIYPVEKALKKNFDDNGNRKVVG